MSPTLISRSTVTARKEHPCSSCGPAHIEPGAQYVRETYVADGRMYTWKLCMPCWEITDEVNAVADDGTYPETYLDWALDNADDPVHGPQARGFLGRVGWEGGA